MPLLLLTLWGKAKFYIIGIALGAVALIGLYFDIENKGENKVRAQETKATDKAVAEKQTDVTAISTESDADMRASLRDQQREFTK